MTVPQAVPFSTLSSGEVAQTPGSTPHYIIKNDPTTFTDLSNGAIATAVDPNTPVLPLPAAKLVLG